MKTQPVVLQKNVQRLSAWTSLVSRTVAIPGVSEAQEYHSLAQADYVNILAVTPDGRIPLVRQYRPALERETLELPGGLRESSEAPQRTAARELLEETGFTTRDEPVLIGSLSADSGRLENRFWCYFSGACDVPRADWQSESHVECVLVGRRELLDMILDGRFDHAMHIALIGLAQMRGLVSF